jgi:hypothetical protein
MLFDISASGAEKCKLIDYFNKSPNLNENFEAILALIFD